MEYRDENGAVGLGCCGRGEVVNEGSEGLLHKPQCSGVTWTTVSVLGTVGRLGVCTCRGDGGLP